MRLKEPFQGEGEFQNIVFNISNQAITYIGGGVIITVLMLIIMNAFGLPFTKILGLIIVGIASVIFGSITINCMVEGECDNLAWIWSFTGLLFLFSTMIFQTVLYKKDE